MVVAPNKKKLSTRLAKYSAAAVAAAATGLMSADVDADPISILGLSLSTSDSLEGFIDIQGFAQGATTFGYSFAQSSFSGNNPLGGPATDFVIRAVFAPTTGTAQIVARNGAAVAFRSYYVTGPGGTGSIAMAVNVGSAFNPVPGTMGTTFFGIPGSTTGNLRLVTWPWQDDGMGNDPGGFAGGTGTMAMTFRNEADGYTHQGWLDVSFQDDGAGFLQQTITGIHVETIGVVPEPASSMILLCMGAAGLATYRRRKSE